MIESGHMQFAFVVDKNQEACKTSIETITDGDVRRALTPRRWIRYTCLQNNVHNI